MSNRQRIILASSVILILIIIAGAAYWWRSDKLAYEPETLVRENRQQWDDLAIKDYQLTVQYKSLPVPQIEYLLTIEDGQVTSAECHEMRNDEPCDAQRFPPTDFTIAELFNKSAKLAARHGSATHFSIVFEPEYHYPQRFGIYTEDVADSGESWEVMAFESIE